jgi:AcrR family transcriptional regulator
MTDTLARPVQAPDRGPAILAAAEIVMERLGHDKLSLGQIAQVSLIPLARIYQYFADRNAVLGALSARALARISASIDPRSRWSDDLDVAERCDRIVDRFAGFLTDPSAAYLVLCGPFDEASEAPRQDAVHQLAAALRNALGSAALGSAVLGSSVLGSAPLDSAADEVNPFRSDEALDYAAELVFACFRRSYLLEGRVSTTAIEMAQHAVSAFVTA